MYFRWELYKAYLFYIIFQRKRFQESLEQSRYTYLKVALQCKLLFDILI